MKISNSKILRLSIFLIGLVLFLFIYDKAASTSCTHDESVSYLNFPQQSFVEIISFSNWFMNNHILNSLSMKYAEVLFGNSELALRLPNLIALLVFMLYSYKILRHKNPILAISVFVLLCTNILLIDLFGLARGYGLSIAAMMVALYHFLSYLEVPKKKHIYYFHFATLLAVLGHFTLLSFYCVVVLLFGLMAILKALSDSTEKFHLLKTIKPHLIPLLINFLVLYEPVRRAILYRQLDFGGKNGFYTDSVTDFIRIYSNGFPISDAFMVTFKIIITLLVAIPFVLIIWKLIQKQPGFFKSATGLIATNFFLLGISLLFMVNHVVLGADYPIGRFAVFLFPIFTLYFGLIIEQLLAYSLKKSALILVSVVALLGAVSFVTKAKSSSYGEWTYDSETKNMLHDLNEYRRMNTDGFGKITLGIDWYFEPTINYYRITKDILWLSPVDRDGIDEEDEYVYCFQSTFETLDAMRYEVIKRYDRSGTVLVKKR